MMGVIKLAEDQFKSFIAFIQIKWIYPVSRINEEPIMLFKRHKMEE